MLENQVVKCLLDTGSSANLLNRKFLSQLSSIQINDTSVQLCGINKTSVQVYGEAHVNLIIGGKVCPLDIIIANITSEVILGIPFITEYCALVNLKTGLLTLPEHPPVVVQINMVQQQLSDYLIVTN